MEERWSSLRQRKGEAARLPMLARCSSCCRRTVSSLIDRCAAISTCCVASSSPVHWCSVRLQVGPADEETGARAVVSLLAARRERLHCRFYLSTHYCYRSSAFFQGVMSMTQAVELLDESFKWSSR